VKPGSARYQECLVWLADRENGSLPQVANQQGRYLASLMNKTNGSPATHPVSPVRCSSICWSDLLK
jgi:hypothetical protein